MMDFLTNSELLLAWAKDHAMVVVLTGFILWLIVAARMLNKQKDTSFYILDLVMVQGMLSKAAVVMMGSYALTTWVIINLTLADKLTEGYLVIYVGAWITPVVVKLITGNGGKTIGAEIPPPCLQSTEPKTTFDGNNVGPDEPDQPK